MRENTSRTENRVRRLEVSFEVSEQPPSLWELVSSEHETRPAPEPPLPPELENDTMVTGPGSPLPRRLDRRVITTVIVLVCVSVAATLTFLIGWR
jgi:hypothetical protein